MVSRRRTRLVGAVVGVALVTSISCGTVEREADVAAALDSLVTELLEQGHLVSGAVVAGRAGEALYERGFGFADVAEGTPFTPDTPANGASVTKTLTAAAILMLERDGRVRLDAPVADYLPEFPYAEVRVRHLLEHSSGLLPDGPLLAGAQRVEGEDHNQVLLDLLVEYTPPLAFAPGRGFLYSNTGYIVAALLIERVTGASYSAFLHERIFEPLEMDSSFVRAAEAHRVQTLGYRPQADAAPELFEASEPWLVYGAYGVDYSARDLYRWVSSFYSDSLLSQAVLEGGLEASELGDGQRSGLSLLNWYAPNVGRRFYFTGDMGGFYTFAYWDADRRYAFVYMSNTLLPSWLRPKLAMALVDILEGETPPGLEDPQYGVANVRDASWDLNAGLPSPEDFAPILGTYEMEPAGRVTIAAPPPDWLNIGWMLEGGWFAPVVRVDGGLTLNMFPVEPGMFYVPGLDAWLGFTETNGEPTLHWTQVLVGNATGRRVER